MIFGIRQNVNSSKLLKFSKILAAKCLTNLEPLVVSHPESAVWPGWSQSCVRLVRKSRPFIAAIYKLINIFEKKKNHLSSDQSPINLPLKFPHGFRSITSFTNSLSESFKRRLKDFKKKSNYFWRFQLWAASIHARRKARFAARFRLRTCRCCKCKKLWPCLLDFLKRIVFKKDRFAQTGKENSKFLWDISSYWASFEQESRL